MVSLGGAALAAVLACLWFALAMPVHWQQVYGSVALARRMQLSLRGLGVLGLSVSWGLCVWANHVSMAALVWVMLLALGVVCTAAALAWQARALRLVWPFAAARLARTRRG